MRIQLTAPIDSAQVSADKATRVISGILIPFGSVGTPSIGPERIMFAADGDHIQAGGDVWLNREHDPGTVLGKLTQLDPSEQGLRARFSVLETQAGSDALVEAAAGARAGLSVEAEIREYTQHEDGLVLITASTITEAALVRHPAFADASVTDVAATAAAQTERETMENTPAAVTTDEQPTQVAAAAPLPSGIRVAEPLPSAADYIVAMGRGDQDRLRDFRARIQAAAPHTFVADVPGLIPTAIVAPVISLRDGSAPLFNALGPNAAPEGASFTLPVITDPLAEAAAATEKSDVTDQMKVDPIAVAMHFIKRAANISAEAIQYTQPGVVNVALGELADAVNLGAEKVIADGIAAATGTNAGASIKADGSDAWAVLAAAVSVHYGACGVRPDVFACAADLWADLAGFTNALGQPLIQGIGQNLSGGWGNLFGVPIVVSPKYGAGTGDLLSTKGVKSWASGAVQMQANEPTIMGFSVGAGRSVGVSVASGKFITPVSIAAPAAARK